MSARRILNVIGFLIVVVIVVVIALTVMPGPNVAF